MPFPTNFTNDLASPAVSKRAAKRAGAAGGPWTKNGVPVLATRYKTQPCRSFAATGACGYGAECMFAHGAHELRTLEENRAAGLVSGTAVRDLQAAACSVASMPSSVAHTEDGGWQLARARLVRPLPCAFARERSAADVPSHEHSALSASSFAAKSAASNSSSSSWVPSADGGNARYRHDPYRAALAVAHVGNTTPAVHLP